MLGKSDINSAFLVTGRKSSPVTIAVEATAKSRHGSVDIRSEVRVGLYEETVGRHVSNRSSYPRQLSVGVKLVIALHLLLLRKDCPHHIRNLP